MMEYRGYVASVEFDYEARLFHGQVVNIRDVVTFQGTSVEELQREFEESVDDYLEFCAERGEEPDKPFSGKLMVRMEPELHRSVATQAAIERTSINKWIVMRLADAVSHIELHRSHSRPIVRRVEQEIAFPFTAMLTAESMHGAYSGFARHWGPLVSSQSSAPVSHESWQGEPDNADFLVEGVANVS